METKQHYQFDATYHYQDGERYNTGRGLSVVSDDLASLEATFRRYQNCGERYACVIKRLDDGEIVRTYGDMKAAERSMMKAYRERFAKAEVK